MSLTQHSVIPLHIQYNYIYMAHSHLLFLPLAVSPLHPFVFPLYPLLLTWHPPVVMGIVHLPLRLLVN